MALNTDLITLPISTLAYIGDAIFELAVREAISATSGGHSGRLHYLSIAYVKASAQAEMLDTVREILTDGEENLVRRAANHQPHSMPKHADQATYRSATALETLWGYLYLDHNYKRLTELFFYAHPEFAGCEIRCLRYAGITGAVDSADETAEVSRETSSTTAAAASEQNTED